MFFFAVLFYFPITGCGDEEWPLFQLMLGRSLWSEGLACGVDAGAPVRKMFGARSRLEISLATMKWT